MVLRVVQSPFGVLLADKSRLKYPGSRGLIGRAHLKTLKKTPPKTLFEVLKMCDLKRMFIGR